MSSDHESDKDYDPTLPVQQLSVRSLSSYLLSEGFAESDVQQLASECYMSINYGLSLLLPYFRKRKGVGEFVQVIFELVLIKAIN